MDLVLADDFDRSLYHVMSASEHATDHLGPDDDGRHEINRFALRQKTYQGDQASSPGGTDGLFNGSLAANV